MARVLVLLPARDFDPSKAAVGWWVLANAGHTVSFATADGRPAVAEEMMLTGKASIHGEPFRYCGICLSSDFWCGANRDAPEEPTPE
jgi:hypothetical protein